MINSLKKIIFLFSFLFFHLAVQAQPDLDSLLNESKKQVDDTGKVMVLIRVAAKYNLDGYPKDEALEAAQEALRISLKLKFAVGEANAYINVGQYFKNKGDNKEALENYLKALSIAEKTDNKAQLSELYDMMGVFYRERMRNYKQALVYALKALQMRRATGNNSLIAISMINTGNVYFDLDDYANALQYFKGALGILKMLKQPNTEADVDNNIGSVYTDLKDYDTAIAYYQQALQIYITLKSEPDAVMCYANIGNVYNLKGDPKGAIKWLQQSVEIARRTGAKDLIASSYSFLAESYNELGDYEKAFNYQLALSNLKDSIFSEESAKQVNEMQVKYDTEKKEKENQILALTINKQRIVTYAVLFGLLLVAGLAFFIYRGYRFKHSANMVLEGKNKIIEEKNKDILDSINYAKRIQNAILTTDEYLAETLGDYFVMYKPRDVVSGDFYWCYAHGDNVIFTVADCTGHGVPGALMSMIGNSLLNEIVVEKQVTDAAKILDMLRGNLLKTLQLKGQQTITYDGMDIVLCVWNKATNELQFSGANNSLYLVRASGAPALQEDKKVKTHPGNVFEIMADKQPVGYMEERMDVPFTSYKIKLAKGDTIYLTSDGYFDQFGGQADKKLTKKKFRELLSANNGLKLQDQKLQMMQALESWQGNNLQTDDICMVGVKFNFA